MYQRKESLIICWTTKYKDLVQIFNIICWSSDYKYYYFDNYSFNSIKILLEIKEDVKELEYLNRFIRNLSFKYKE